MALTTNRWSTEWQEAHIWQEVGLLIVPEGGRIFSWRICKVHKNGVTTFNLSFSGPSSRPVCLILAWKHRASTSVASRRCLCWFSSHMWIHWMFFLTQRLSVCDNCTWILDCEAGHGLLPSFTRVALSSVSWWYVKTVRRLLLHRQVLPFNSRCAFSRLAL